MNNTSLQDETTPLMSRSYSQSTITSFSGSQQLEDSSIRRGARKPFHYPVGTAASGTQNEVDSDSLAVYNRLKYYNKLRSPEDNALTIPDHIVPVHFFIGLPLLLPSEENAKQSSLVTVFVIWNTMMGTSLLGIPWAISQAGFITGVSLMVLMAGLCTYTAYLILSVHSRLGLDSKAQFSEICETLLGKWASVVSVLFSLAGLLGAIIVYWVLGTNFLFHIVTYLYDVIAHVPDVLPIENSTYPDVLCPSANVSSSHHALEANSESPLFKKIWNMYYTVPFFMIFILCPLINFKSPSFFAKFSAMGTLSVFYLLIFVSTKASQWGFNFSFHFSSPNPHDGFEFKTTFPSLTGTMSLACFIHNCILSIMSCQKNPQNNVRDLSIAYLLVASTYIFIGVVFYTCYPLAKDCIQDNLLNNITTSDLLAFLARFFLFFQLVTVSPLVMYIFRIQLLHYLFGNVYPGLKHVVILNACLICICILFAVFLPKIGTVIRFSGALSGLAYIFSLPCLTHMAALRRENKLSFLTLLVHGIIILLGFANFAGQFVVLFIK